MIVSQLLDDAKGKGALSALTTDQTKLEEKPNHEVGVLLPFLESVCKSQRQLLGIKLGELDVAVGQDQFLLSFENDQLVPVADVAERLSVRSSTVSKMTDRLEEKGWVTRSSGTDDKRQVFLQLTRSGLKVREAVRAAESEIEAELLKALGGGTQIVAALNELDHVLAKRLRRLR